MKKQIKKLLAVAVSAVLIMAGCSETDSSDSSKSQNSSEISESSQSTAETTDGVDDSAIADVIPWEGEGNDPMGSAQGDDNSSSASAGSSSKADTQSTSSSSGTSAASAATQAQGGANSAAPAEKPAQPAKPAASPAKPAATPTPAPAPTPASGTPVQRHGALRVSGNHIVDSHGQAFMLQGMSTHGIMWETFSNILSQSSLKVLRDDWKCNAVRIAMYTEEWGGYTTGSSYAAQAKQKVMNGVANATNLGMYVIIDWHILKDGNPLKHQSEAIAFFKDMANRYKNYNNVIFELCNEPNGGVTWASQIKPYCQAVVNAIRGTGAKNLIICGTGTWSQDINQVVGNKLSDSNCAYTLHFYARTHTDWLRKRLQDCYNSVLPVLVTEFGTCDASGNGGFDENQTRQWYNLLRSLKVGWFNWSASNKAETASAFVPGTNLAAISAGESQLTQSGKLIRNLFRANAANT